MKSNPHVKQNAPSSRTAASRLSCTFFGTTTLHFSDGRTSFFIDAFFSRPALLRMKFWWIKPDEQRINEALELSQISHLDGIFVAHTHYDHVMDAPTVINKLGGRLFGSSSTLNIGRGAGLKEEFMQLIAEGEQHVLGKFTINIYEGLHSPGDMFPGVVEEPLLTPAKGTEYKTGKCYSFHIIHPEGSFLVHPSANFVPNKFTNVKVDLLYLGIGVLGNQTEDFREQYLKYTADAMEFNMLVPIHWDNLTGSLTNTQLTPLPWWLDSFSKAKELLDRKARANGWKLYWQNAFEAVSISKGNIETSCQCANPRKIPWQPCRCHGSEAE